jgi:ppGpp synthetase/RelA/SpoT-type nucleotidyltranferase
MNTDIWTPEKTYADYLLDHDFYVTAASSFVNRVEASLKSEAISAHMISGRAKDPLELYKKQVRKNYANPWADCPDLVGARVIVPSSNEKAAVVKALLSIPELTVLEVEDQTLGSDPSRLRYTGLHVHLQDQLLRNSNSYPVRCEVQIRTIAEHAWSETTHRYVYKQPISIPRDTERTFLRLLVLVELFDKELAVGAHQVSELDSFKQLEFARFLETAIATYIDSPNDLGMTLSLIRDLCANGYGQPADLRAEVEAFVEQNEAFLRQFYAENAATTEGYDVRHDWFLSQAESLLMLTLLKQDEYKLGSILESHDLYSVIENLALKVDCAGFVHHH